MAKKKNYMRETCETFKLIPKEEYIRVMYSGDSELDCEFLCFEENYIPLVPYIPDDWTVVDLGCYQAAQAYHFTGKAAYVGVDCFDLKKYKDYNPPERFKPHNAVHMYETIQDFIKYHLAYFDLSKTYFIMSAVNDFDATAELYSKVKHAYMAYPGKTTHIKGINSESIGRAVKCYRENARREGVVLHAETEEVAKAS